VAQEGVEIDAEARGVLGQIGPLERLLVLEQHVVHRPEALLRAGSLGGLGRGERVRMLGGQREAAKHEAQARAEHLLQRLDRVVGAGAEGTLEVAVLDERDRRAKAAVDVIVGMHGRTQEAHASQGNERVWRGKRRRRGLEVILLPPTRGRCVVEPVQQCSKCGAVSVDRAQARLRLSDYLKREGGLGDEEAGRRADAMVGLMGGGARGIALAATSALTSNWWLVLLRGILAVLFGIFALASPLAAFGALVLVFGVWAFIDGIDALA